MRGIEGNTVSVSVRVPRALYEALRYESFVSRKSMAGIIREALRAVLMETEDELRKEDVN